MPGAKLIGVLSPDRGGQLSRLASNYVEVYVRPLSYGDLAEFSATVWADGKVHVTIKDSTGSIVGTYHYERPEGEE